MKKPLLAYVAILALCASQSSIGQERARQVSAGPVGMQVTTASNDALQAAADQAAAGAASASAAAARAAGKEPRLTIVASTHVVQGPAPVVSAPASVPIEVKREVAKVEVKSAEPPKPAGPPAQKWNIEIRDLNLANTFHRWAGAAGWRVRWDAAQNVMVEAPDSFTGTFEEAITSQLSSPGIAQGEYPLEVCFYPNVPPLARITRKGDQTKECQ